MENILFGPGKEIIQAEDVMPLLNQAIAKMRSQETGAAGDQYAFLMMKHRF